MSSLEIRVEPSSMGLDAVRLERIQTHFDTYVADRRLPGWLATVSRGDELVWTGKGGHRDRELDLAVTDDTMWRIYSMTKPLTSIAAMMLYEEGRFDLNDDVGQWIEDLREPRVYVSGAPTNPVTVPALEPVRVHAGLSDGTRTQVTGNGLKEGMQIIVGANTGTAASTPATTNPLQQQSTNRRGSGGPPGSF